MAVRYMKDNNGKFVINPEVASSLYSANSAGDFYKKVAILVVGLMEESLLRLRTIGKNAIVFTEFS